MKGSCGLKSWAWATKPQKLRLTKRSPTDSRGKRYTRSNGSARLAKCLHGKNTGYGRGYWTCIRDSSSSTKDASLRRGGSARALPDFSIILCCPERQFSHIFFWRASRSRSERRPLQKPRRKRPWPGLSACKRRGSRIKRTFSADSLSRAAPHAL